MIVILLTMGMKLLVLYWKITNVGQRYLIEVATNDVSLYYINGSN